MSFSVAGKHALITGAGAGINLAFAKLLLQRGCSVTIGDIGLRPGAEELLRQYPHVAGDNSKRPAAIFHKTDVASWPQLNSLWARATSAFPSVDIVCPGAGIFEPEWSSFWEPPVTKTNPTSPSRDRADGEPGTYAQLNINLTHPIRLSQLALGHWLGEKSKAKVAAGEARGVLLHVSSIAGQSSSIGTPIYYATKHGLHAFTRSLGSLRDTVGVRVSAIAPCAVRVTSGSCSD
jgi:NAD(P)-dependent dehydrogenase (short-subunit alcohol dehydrogenase family)